MNNEVDLVGVKADGTQVNLGKMTTPPRMRARELAREQFGDFEEDDGSDAELCFYALERMIEHMEKPATIVLKPEPLKLSLDQLIDLRDALTDAISDGMGDLYHCKRVWSAWNVGTMSESDFEPVSESDTPGELAEDMIEVLKKSGILK